jgi:hypothetical protein
LKKRKFAILTRHFPPSHWTKRRGRLKVVTMKTLARIASVLAFGFCLLGGLWILCRADLKNFKGGDDALSIAIGFYFVGKAFFVGPMLWIAAEKLDSKPDVK